jgi:hypothetical protein
MFDRNAWCRRGRGFDGDCKKQMNMVGGLAAATVSLPGLSRA